MESLVFKQGKGMSEFDKSRPEGSSNPSNSSYFVKLPNTQYTTGLAKQQNYSFNSECPKFKPHLFTFKRDTI